MHAFEPLGNTVFRDIRKFGNGSCSVGSQFGSNPPPDLNYYRDSIHLPQTMILGTKRTSAELNL